MSNDSLGSLVPLGGGDPIPLIRETMTIGRRSSSDICLKFQDVSGSHCELTFLNGIWVAKDLNSSNGTKVNGEKISRQALRPNDTIGFGKHKFVIHYDLRPGANISQIFDEEEDMFSQPLLEKVGLAKPRRRDS